MSELEEPKNREYTRDELVARIQWFRDMMLVEIGEVEGSIEQLTRNNAEAIKNEDSGVIGELSNLKWDLDRRYDLLTSFDEAFGDVVYWKSLK